MMVQIPITKVAAAAVGTSSRDHVVHGPRGASRDTDPSLIEGAEGGQTKGRERAFEITYH